LVKAESRRCLARTGPVVTTVAVLALAFSMTYGCGAQGLYDPPFDLVLPRVEFKGITIDAALAQLDESARALSTNAVRVVMRDSPPSVTYALSSSSLKQLRQRCRVQRSRIIGQISWAADSRTTVLPGQFPIEWEDTAQREVGTRLLRLYGVYWTRLDQLAEEAEARGEKGVHQQIAAEREELSK